MLEMRECKTRKKITSLDGQKSTELEERRVTALIYSIAQTFGDTCTTSSGNLHDTKLAARRS
jgi:hypothetical protein